MTARVLERASLLLVASPDYLDRHGTPMTLDELDNHQLLPFVMPSTGRYGPWSLMLDGKPLDWTPRDHLRVRDDVLGCVSLAEAGAGICQSYDFVVRDRIDRGRLVEILPQHGGRTRPFSLLFPSHRNLSAATRRLIDYLSAS